MSKSFDVVKGNLKRRKENEFLYIFLRVKVILYIQSCYNKSLFTMTNLRKRMNCRLEKRDVLLTAVVQEFVIGKSIVRKLRKALKGQIQLKEKLVVVI